MLALQTKLFFCNTAVFVVNIFYVLVYFNKIRNPLITLKPTLTNFNHILPAFGIAR